ncbi:hypothetical protein TcasGA2_TC033304 [Tribolium castaneum]|uniref:Uncharacterized protein n=1 Tax=Tribolium castaneum TaxID=7070 RepID=A0A139WGW8_TRICA|nr:hypothetical protein TcasGA2_TC033304 [Tribolium castaneum]
MTKIINLCFQAASNFLQKNTIQRRKKSLFNPEIAQPPSKTPQPCPKLSK